MCLYLGALRVLSRHISVWALAPSCSYFGRRTNERGGPIRRLVTSIVRKDEIDEECREWEEGGLEENEAKRLSQMSFVQRTWERMW